jgi:branched-subunit amino acid ABC-type transport system permease component
MTDYLPFIVVGVVSGSLYGLAAVGLVLTYKTTGILNFSHGAIAAFAAYLFQQLRVDLGLGWPLALVMCVGVIGPVTGLILEFIGRGLSRTPTSARVVATVGLQVGLVGLIFALYGTASKPFPAFLPQHTLRLGSLYVTVGQLLSVIIAATAAIGLYLLLQLSTAGVKMRAVVDNPDLVELTGADSIRVRRTAWAIGVSFAALSGVLLAPAVGLDASLLTLLVLQAFGAAAIAGFNSLPLTFVGGIVVGILAALSTKFVATYGATQLQGITPSLPFIILFIVLLVYPRRRLLEAGRAITKARPIVTDKRLERPLLGALLCVGVIAPFAAPDRLPVFSQAVVLVIVFQALAILVQLSGQVSLCHAAFVAVGAAVFAHLSAGVGVPWLLAVVLAALAAVPVGLVVSIPAIRLSGIYLAIATFGFGVLMEQLVYRFGFLYGLKTDLPAARPHVLGLSSDRAYYYLCLVVAVGSVAWTAALGRSRLGRLLRAQAEAPTTLTTSGLAVNVTRVTVFCITAAMAAIGGALGAGSLELASSNQYTSLTSLLWLAALMMAGSGVLTAPVLAALFVGVLPAYLPTGWTPWLPVLFGAGAIAASLMQGGSTRLALTSVETAGRRRPGISPVFARAGLPLPHVSDQATAGAP